MHLSYNFLKETFFGKISVQPHTFIMRTCFESILWWRALARQLPILDISQKNQNFVGCKIGSMPSWLLLYYPGNSFVR